VLGCGVGVIVGVGVVVADGFWVGEALWPPRSMIRVTSGFGDVDTLGVLTVTGLTEDGRMMN